MRRVCPEISLKLKNQRNKTHYGYFFVQGASGGFKTVLEALLRRLWWLSKSAGGLGFVVVDDLQR